MKNVGNHTLRDRSLALLKLLWIYLVSLLGPLLLVVIPTKLLGWSEERQFSNLYLLGTLGQALMDLPALILFLRERPHMRRYARLSVHISSAGVGLAIAVIFAGMRIALFGELMGGEFMGGVPAFTQSLALSCPWNVFSAGAALLAYGPGEAIFVVTFIHAFDNALGCQDRLFSWGVGITAFLWALPHIINVFYFGWKALSNVLIMAFMGLVMGVLLKRTRSSWGPILFWTLVNGTSV